MISAEAAPAEYSHGVIKTLLENWTEVTNSDSELMLVMRADMELALGHLGEYQRKVAGTILVAGEDAVKCGAVKQNEYAVLVALLYYILNSGALCGNRTERLAA